MRCDTKVVVSSLDKNCRADCLPTTALESLEVNPEVRQAGVVVNPVTGLCCLQVARFLIVTAADLEERMDVDLWLHKVNTMDNVQIKVKCNRHHDAS